jgi:hypothetical protein
MAAGWTLDSKGTIVQFCEGLLMVAIKSVTYTRHVFGNVRHFFWWLGVHKIIHSKALDRDKIPCTIDEWKVMAHNEVAQAKEQYNAGLTGAQRRNQQRPRDFRNFQHQSNPPRQQQSNPNHVPMDVDAANITQFKKLTPEERAQLTKEGRCFRCCLQGHMARNCPKNTNNNIPTIRTNKTPVLPKTSIPVTAPATQTSTPSTPSIKLTHAQQIRAIEEAMCYDNRLIRLLLFSYHLTVSCLT